MAELRDELLEALKLRYTAQLYEARATLDIYLNNPVGVGEHPQIIDEMDKQVEKYGNALDRLSSISDLYGEHDLTVADEDD